MATIKHGRDTLNDHVAINEENLTRALAILENVKHELNLMTDNFCTTEREKLLIGKFCNDLGRARQYLVTDTFKFEAEKSLLVKK